MKKEAGTLYADEKTIRLVAFQVLVIAFVSLVGQWAYLFLFLALDFFLRAFTSARSPLATSAKAIARVLKLKPQLIFAAPKRFAASLGFIFSTFVFVSFALQWNTAGYITGSILIFCALLESAFGICVGCYVFDLVVAPLKRGRVFKVKWLNGYRV